MTQLYLQYSIKEEKRERLSKIVGKLDLYMYFLSEKKWLGNGVNIRFVEDIKCNAEIVLTKLHAQKRRYNDRKPMVSVQWRGI